MKAWKWLLDDAPMPLVALILGVAIFGSMPWLYKLWCIYFRWVNS